MCHVAKYEICLLQMKSTYIHYIERDVSLFYIYKLSNTIIQNYDLRFHFMSFVFYIFIHRVEQNLFKCLLFCQRTKSFVNAIKATQIKCNRTLARKIKKQCYVHTRTC